MRVPTLNGPSVAPTTTQVLVPNGPGGAGLEALQRGIAQGGGALGQAAGQAVEVYQRAQHEADVVEARDALTAFGDDITTELHGDQEDPEKSPGVYSVKGRDAVDAANLGLEELETKRRDRSEKLRSDNAKRLFLQQSGQMLMGTKRDIAGHVDQQIEVAKADSVKASVDEAIRATTLDPTNDALAKQRIADTVGPLHALAGGRDDFANEKSLEVQGIVAGGRIDALLSGGNWQKAQEVLLADKRAIGDKADEYSKRIEKVKGLGEADALAGRIIVESTTEKGELNQAAALRKLNQLPADQQAKVRPVLSQRMTEQEQAFAADTKRVSQAAFSLYNKVGWTEFQRSAVSDELNDRNPELWNRLQNDAFTERERAKREKRQSAEDRRAQSQINTVARNEYLALPISMQAQTDLDQFLAGRGVDDVTRSAMKVDQRKAVDVSEKGQAVSLQQFVADAKANASSWLVPGKTPDDKLRVKQFDEEFTARATDAWMQWREDHKGAPPMGDEADKLIGDIIKKLTPINARQASQSANAVVRQGTSKVTVLPELDLSAGAGAPKPSYLERVQQLKAQGKTKDEARAALKAEGY